MIGADIVNCEGIQGIHYEDGGYFNAHTDYFEHYESDVCGKSGNRIMTARLYLEDILPENEGELDFPIVAHSIRPKKGMLCYWNNMTNGLPSLASVHSDRPVKGATNTYLVNYIRERSYF